MEKNEIVVSGSGELAPANQQQLLQVITDLIKGEGFPQHLNTITKAMAAWNFAAQLGLKPQIACRQIAVIKGTPAIFGDLPRALAERTGELERCETYVFDSEYNRISFSNKNLKADVFGSVTFIKRKGKDVQEYVFTLDDARRAGKYPAKEGTPWFSYTKIMLQRKSEGFALKKEFADALNGCAIAEYDFDEIPNTAEPKDVTPTDQRPQNEADALWRELKHGTDETQANTAVDAPGDQTVP